MPSQHAVGLFDRFERIFHLPGKGAWLLRAKNRNVFICLPNSKSYSLYISTNVLFLSREFSELQTRVLTRQIVREKADKA
jgi:hypothetical protein